MRGVILVGMMNRDQENRELGFFFALLYIFIRNQLILMVI